MEVLLLNDYSTMQKERWQTETCNQLMSEEFKAEVIHVLKNLLKAGDKMAK